MRRFKIAIIAPSGSVKSTREAAGNRQRLRRFQFEARTSFRCITLRLLRSAASPESVGFGRPGSDASGLLSTSLPAGHLFPETIVEIKRAPRRRPFVDLDTDRAYLILPSTNSTCFFAIGSYFFIFS